MPAPQHVVHTAEAGEMQLRRILVPLMPMQHPPGLDAGNPQLQRVLSLLQHAPLQVHDLP